MITQSIIGPTRVVWPAGAGGDFLAASARPATILLSGSANPAEPGSVGPSVVLDFRVEMYGGIRLTVVEVLGKGPGGLRIRLGESVSEAMLGLYVDHEESVQAGSKLDPGVTGFRFARLDLVRAAVGVRIEIPEAYALADAIPRLGSFTCSDPRLDQVWEVGARTTHLCMQTRIWDGIKRGRSVWAGDLHPAAAVIAAVFGAHTIVGASLDKLRDETASATGDEWMNGIPAYSLWWIITQAEWFLATGNQPYLTAQHGYLTHLLGVIARDVGPDGREHFQGWRYLDWASTRDSVAIHVGYQGLTAWAMRSAQMIATVLGDRAMHAQAGKILARVEAYRRPATTSKAAVAMLVLGGLADPVVANHAVLTPEPAANLTPFLGYHVLEARAMAGDHAGAIALIGDYWGAMIELGATTFWEDFDLDWVAGSGRIDEVVPADLRDIHAGLGRNIQRGMGLSLCHAWSAGPTAWLSRHVLGIQPQEPGCRVVRIAPHLGDLSRAEGTFPTPLGVIHVRHHRQPDGSITTEFEAPEGIEVVAG